MSKEGQLHDNSSGEESCAHSPIWRQQCCQITELFQEKWKTQFLKENISISKSNLNILKRF